MGWDFEFTLDYPDWANNREKLTVIVESMLHSGLFKFEEMSILSYHLIKASGSLQDAKIASFTDSQGTPLQTLNDWTKKYTEHGLLFDIVFSVERFWRLEEDARFYGVHLYAFDDEFLSYPGLLPTGLTYDSHTSKLYSPGSNPGDYYENFQLLLDELEIFVKAGITTIRGLGNEQMEGILTQHLCYHQDISDFLADVSQIDSNHPDIKQFGENEFLEVMGRCENILSKRIQDSFFIYSARGTDRTLSEFYQSLLNWCKEQDDKNA